MAAVTSVDVLADPAAVGDSATGTTTVAVAVVAVAATGVRSPLPDIVAVAELAAAAVGTSCGIS